MNERKKYFHMDYPERFAFIMAIVMVIYFFVNPTDFLRNLDKFINEFIFWN